MNPCKKQNDAVYHQTSEVQQETSAPQTSTAELEPQNDRSDGWIRTPCHTLAIPLPFAHHAVTPWLFQTSQAISTLKVQLPLLCRADVMSLSCPVLEVKRNQHSSDGKARVEDTNLPTQNVINVLEILRWVQRGIAAPPNCSTSTCSCSTK